MYSEGGKGPEAMVFEVVFPPGDTPNILLEESQPGNKVWIILIPPVVFSLTPAPFHVFTYSFFPLLVVILHDLVTPVEPCEVRPVSGLCLVYVSSHHLFTRYTEFAHSVFVC